jgi:hypothetical protein
MKTTFVFLFSIIFGSLFLLKEESLSKEENRVGHPNLLRTLAKKKND